MSSQELYNWKRDGQGMPVICLHGFLEDSSMWNYLPLDGFEKIMVDLPGHGESEVQSKTSIIDWAKDIFTHLKDLNLENVPIIGHSMGGYVALELLNINPSIGKVVLLNSNYWSDSKEKRQNRTRIAELVKTKKDFFVQEVIPNLFQTPSAHRSTVLELIVAAQKMKAESMSTASIAMANRADHSELVKKHIDKIHLIHGSNDSVVTNELLKLHRVDGLDVHRLDTGHMSHVEDSAGTNKIVMELLQKNNGNF